MASTTRSYNVLPKDLLELQLGQVDLLMAMYASDNAVLVDDESMRLLDELRDWCESDGDTAPKIPSSAISMLLTLSLSDVDDTSPNTDESLQLEISVPVVHELQEPAIDATTEPPQVKVRVRRPAWMSKAESASLTAGIPHEDMLTTIEHVKDAASRHLANSRLAFSAPPPVSEASKYADEPTVRVWFYFPSISTRSKRDDIINYAPSYGLTGFLLAGKPGILCLEGGTRAIDDYMKFIKTESWGDIPPQHKKVSERYRETPLGLIRAFHDMQEITDMVGERRGERANRGDMKAFEAWLNENGLGEAFGKILV